MHTLLIKNATIVNDGEIFIANVLCKNDRIEKIDRALELSEADTIIDATGKHLLPGVIDDQVHFREPGFTHKADIQSESRAGVAGGVTTFMEMPNTNPQAVTIEELEKKYDRAAEVSPANYSFFMGATNNNIEEIKKVNPKTICGVKIFMGSSTGDMLVDNEKALNDIYEHSPTLIATHCEDEDTIKRNMELARQKYGEDVPFSEHPVIRSREACIMSSELAISLAKKHNSRLHILHISTAEETELFDNSIPLEEKRITSEVCVHHMWFEKDDYETLGSKIKCNPAIKTKRDKDALLAALKNNKLDIIATDHAPHTAQEKAGTYFSAPSGLPLLQHTLVAMLDFVANGDLELPFVVEKMSHAPAKCFQIEDRGYIKEGYFADFALVDLNKKYKVEKSNIEYKCGWSPFEGHSFSSTVETTIVNGQIVYNQGEVKDITPGQRLTFNR